MHKPKPIQAADTLWGQGRRAMKDLYGPQTRGCEGACAIKLCLAHGPRFDDDRSAMTGPFQGFGPTKPILTGISLEWERLEARTLKTTLKTPFLGRITIVPSEVRSVASLFVKPMKSNHSQGAWIANRMNSQTMRDLNRETGRTCDEISSSRERLAEMSIEVFRPVLEQLETGLRRDGTSKGYSKRVPGAGGSDDRSDARSAGTASNYDEMFRGFSKLNARFV
ncbi:hypothetical protein EDD85DRAFT_997315 [Armillaria nabsnona]|nr:hypothetical protein EDD85DRAFT_997315 [Armillaria nabsnona]